MIRERGENVRKQIEERDREKQIQEKYKKIRKLRQYKDIRTIGNKKEMKEERRIARFRVENEIKEERYWEVEKKKHESMWQRNVQMKKNMERENN